MTAGDIDYEEGVAKLPDGAELAYQVHGRAHGGIPLLLIRPVGGAMSLWGPFRTLLAEQLQVISFDYRGTGKSSRDPAWVTTPGLARDALTVLEHLRVPKAHVFGISLGGMTATWLAILAPARVAGLCIASASARGLDLSRAGLRHELGLAACFVRPRADAEVCLVERILSQRFREHHAEEVRRIAATLRREPARRVALLKHTLAALLHDARRELHRIQAPTLVLAGEDDTLLGTAPSCALAKAIPRASFEIIPTSGHALALEQPVLTATRVARFMLSSTAQFIVQTS